MTSNRDSVNLPSNRPTEHHLKWVTHNHQPRRRGGWIGSLADHLASRELADRQRFHFVRKALASIDDPSFFRMCNLESVTHGRLVLLVSDADVRYHMEKRWRSVLADALTEASGSMRPWEVVFRVAHDLT